MKALRTRKEMSAQKFLDEVAFVQQIPMDSYGVDPSIPPRNGVQQNEDQRQPPQPVAQPQNPIFIA